MTFIEDLRTLLTDELDGPDEESALYGALTGSPLLLEFVQSLVGARDVESLRTLCHGSVELHELTERYGTVPGSLPTPAEEPFAGCGAVTGAVRAVAALGLVLIDEEVRLADHLAVALTWLAHTRAAAETPWPTGRQAPECAHHDRLAAAVTALGTDPYGTTVVVWLLALQKEDPKKGATATVDVLLDRGDLGVRATLRATTLRGLPPALVPDPWTMLLFTADDRFRSGLEIAWRTAGHRRRDGDVRGAVLWSLAGVDGPVDHVQDISLTAAFTVIVDEMRRMNRRLRGPLTVRRLGGSTAVVGGVDDQGRMVGVTGYRNKLAVAAALDRVVVPDTDLKEAQEHAGGLQTTVVGVREWQEAARRSRIPDRRAWLRVLLVCVLVLTAGSGTGLFVWNGNRQTQELRDTAAKVLDQAYEQDAEVVPELRLLLAMASDDIAQKAGDKTDALATMAGEISSLRRLLRPEEGRFDQLALSRNGAWGALSTSTGAVQVVSTKSGDVVWRQKGSGVEPTARGVFVHGLAVSPLGQRVAFATSDLRLTIVEQKNASWSVAKRIALPIPSHPGLLNTERNRVDHLEFTSDRRSLVLYVDTIGMLVYDVRHFDAAPRRCPERGTAETMRAGENEVLLTKGREVVRVDLKTCARSVVLTAPEGTQLHGAVTDGGVVAAATRGAQLLVLGPKRPETLIADRGPYETVSITSADDGAHLSATRLTGRIGGTYGWNVERRTQEYGFPGAGPSLMGNDMVLRHRGGVAELHDGDHSAATRAWNRFYGGMGSLAWAGEDLVLRSGPALYVLPGAKDLTSETMADPAHFHRLAMPKGTTSAELATSRTGPWAAALYSRKGERSRDLAVWNLKSRRTTPVPLPNKTGLRHVAFVGGDLYAGYSDGEVRRFTAVGGSWRSAGSRRLAAGVTALGGGGKDADRLYAVISTGSADRPSVVALRTSDLAVTATRRLEGGTALARVEVMRDGQVVVGSGAGAVTFLTADLQPRGRVSDGKLKVVMDLTEIPDRGLLLVSGQLHSAVFGLNTMTPRDAWTRGAPFQSADAAADGGVLATYSFATLNVALWTLGESDLRARVCRAVGRDLTEEEWRQYVDEDVVPYTPVCKS
ncbi:hypothetical protein ACGFYZ_31875 [Streptomyces sp. NPDC048330]|uniref:hypothetical protein n=1 Tax=Streptomyces sp. NPDC048330 TaxID=3365533 RepID=UPI00371CF70B